MKNLITSIVLILFTLSAQAAGEAESLKIQATDISRRLANQIGLNESEYILVKKFTTEKLFATAEIKDMYRNNPEMMDRKLDEIEATFTQNIQNTLSNEQLDKYISIRSSLKPDRNYLAETQEP